MDFPLEYLFLILAGLPYYVIWLGGIVYAFVRRHKHPRTSLLAGIGLGLMLVVGVASAVLSAYFMYQASHGGSDMAEEYARSTQTFSLCTIPISMGSWILLLIATFGWRNLTESESTNQDIR